MRDTLTRLNAKSRTIWLRLRRSVIFCEVVVLRFNLCAFCAFLRLFLALHLRKSAFICG